MPSYSVCIIAKNEEHHIEQCLQSIQALQCEVILTDTGSTDNTIELARKFNVRICPFQWTNDFSAARNYSLSCASNDWVLILDCDEWVNEAAPSRWPEFMQMYPDRLGLIKRINLANPANVSGAYTDWIPRFFNRKLYRYTGSIHEQVTPYASRPLQGFQLPLTILHSGYVGSDEEIMQKHRRNTAMLQKELEKSPGNPYYCFQMGQEYYNQYAYDKAIAYYEKVLACDLPHSLEYLRLTVLACGECLIHLNRAQEALALKKYESDLGNNPDFAYLMGRIFLALSRPLEALAEFIKAVSMNNPYKEGTNTYLSWYHIALINEQLGELKTARTFYEKCGDFKPAEEKLKKLM